MWRKQAGAQLLDNHCRRPLPANVQPLRFGRQYGAAGRMRTRANRPRRSALAERCSRRGNTAIGQVQHRDVTSWQCITP